MWEREEEKILHSSVPFDEVADFDYMSTWRRKKMAEQAAPAEDDGFRNWVEGEDTPPPRRRREKRSERSRIPSLTKT